MLVGLYMLQSKSERENKWSKLLYFIERTTVYIHAQGAKGLKRHACQTRTHGTMHVAYFS
jgi:hypothetical protein